MYGLFQVFALFGLPRVRAVLQQAQNRGRSRPAQERIKKVLKMKNYRPPQYFHAIKGLLESYDIWKTVEPKIR